MKKHVALENLQIVDTTLQRWLVFKKHFLKAFTAEAITPGDEQEFLEIKSEVSKNARILNERLKDIPFGGDRIGAILRQSISVDQLRSLPVPDRRGLYKEWHAVFVYLNQARGALEFIAQGWIPRFVAVKEGTSIAAIKSGTSDRKKKKSLVKPIVITVIVLLALAGGAYYYLNR